MFFFLGVGTISCFWKTEAEYSNKKNIRVFPRPQSSYFERKGTCWQHFGFGGTLICALLLLVDALSYYFLGSTLISERVVITLKTSLTSIDILIICIEYSIVFGFVLLTTWLAQRALAKILSYFAGKSWAMLIAFLGVAMLLILAPLTTHVAQINRETVSSAILVLLSVVGFMSYENIDYQQYMLLHLKENLKVIRLLWFSYFFTSDSGLSFLVLLKLTGRLATDKMAKAMNDLSRGDSDLSRFFREDPCQR